MQCKVIAVVNQKGGVGKTTTTFNLGVGLARMGKRVALIDCDPQGDLTICCGYPNNDDIDTTIATLMKKIINDEEIEADEGIIHQAEGVDLIPANIELSSMDLTLITIMNREKVLDAYISEIKPYYDYILNQIGNKRLIYKGEKYLPYFSVFLQKDFLLRDLFNVSRYSSHSLTSSGVMLIAISILFLFIHISFSSLY